MMVGESRIDSKGFLDSNPMGRSMYSFQSSEHWKRMAKKLIPIYIVALNEFERGQAPQNISLLGKKERF